MFRGKKKLKNPKPGKLDFRYFTSHEYALPEVLNAYCKQGLSIFKQTKGKE